MPRILNEEKKEQFISSAENIDYTKVSPNDVQSPKIEVEYLYKTGCPYNYIATSKKLCGKENPKSTYCNLCSDCWLYNLTDNVEDDSDSNDDLLNKYLDIGLNPSQIKEILNIFEWDKLNDFEMLKEVIYEIINKMREE